MSELAGGLHTRNLGGHMAVAVSGIDLGRDLDDAIQARLRQLLKENLVLCIRDQKLGPVPFRDAMARFGPPLKRLQLERTRECDEVNIVSSEDRDVLGDGGKLVNGASWHTDDSFMRHPCKLTMLYGVIVPPSGGDTQFANMQAAYDALPEETRAHIADLRVIHKYQSSRQTNRVSRRPEGEMKAMPEAVHPLVKIHPETGRKALYLNANRMEQVVGMERDESDRLLDRLIAHAIRPEFQYRHAWRKGDVVIWDNRCTMHRANADYDEGERRLMHRAVVG